VTSEVDVGKIQDSLKTSEHILYKEPKHAAVASMRANIVFDITLAHGLYIILTS